jgi:hypothetical protein
MKGYLFTIFALISINSNAQIQFGIGGGLSRVKSELKVFPLYGTDVLLDSVQTSTSPSIFVDMQHKNFGIVATYTQHIYGLNLDYSKSIFNDVINVGVGAGLLINNWPNINDNYKSNLLIQGHSAPLTDGIKTACGVITGNCDIRIFRSLKTRISLSKNLGTIGYDSQSDTYICKGQWVGKTEYYKNPTVSVSLYYSFEQKVKGSLVLDPEPKRSINFQ